MTGRKALYFGAKVTVGIEGWSQDKALAFIADLTVHATQDAFVYRHVWRVGDAVLWDNRRVLHAAMPFDLDNDRTPKPPPPDPEEEPDEYARPKVPVQLEPVSVFLDRLRAQGKIEPPSPPLPRPLLEEARRGYVVVDERSWSLPGNPSESPRPPPSSWKLDLHTLRRAPRRRRDGRHCGRRHRARRAAARRALRRHADRQRAAGAARRED